MVKISTIKKVTIPKRVRELVWKKNVGKKWRGKCYVSWCDNYFNVMSAWHVGHNQPESKGGSIDINNLKPICSECNLGMGNRHTIDEWSSLFSGKVFSDYEKNVIDILESIKK